MRNNHLAEWLADKRGEAYFGKTFSVRASVLAHILTGTGTLADIAREHKISRQAIHRHYKRAVAVYGASTAS